VFCVAVSAQDYFGICNRAVCGPGLVEIAGSSAVDEGRQHELVILFKASTIRSVKQ
jgi:hypothetical protein